MRKSWASFLRESRRQSVIGIAGDLLDSRCIICSLYYACHKCIKKCATTCWISYTTVSSMSSPLPAAIPSPSLTFMTMKYTIIAPLRLSPPPPLPRSLSQSHLVLTGVSPSQIVFHTSTVLNPYQFFIAADLEYYLLLVHPQS